MGGEVEGLVAGSVAIGGRFERLALGFRGGRLGLRARRGGEGIADSC